jgi:DNA polymerase
MRSLSIDIETYSSVDLAPSGVYRYAESPDFEIMLFAYSVDGGEVVVIDLAGGERLPPAIQAALIDPGVTKWAFNAQFERICLSKWLGLAPGRYLDPRSWRCTMVWSAYLGLPLSLEKTGLVLGLKKPKLTGGQDLIRYFSRACRPTAANGGRTRNLPLHAPDKWAAFKAYNRRDVETEMAIQQKLARFPVGEDFWEEYHLDQEINDRGVLLDQALVGQAIAMDQRSRSQLTGRMRELTGLPNPNSVAQVKQWLSAQGLPTAALDKKAVAELLKTAPEPLCRVLELRQSLAKSSVKKYTAMEKAVCADGRARGMFQFYGANRTGRWAGRLIQLQNLPQNHLPDLEAARSLVVSGNFAALEMLYDSVPEVLSELIRSAFVPPPGSKFIVADFAAIEARVIAWLAGEKWRQAVFAAGGDIYCASASKMFHVPVEKNGVNSHLRQDRGTGPRIRRIGGSLAGHGRLGDGAKRGRTAAAGGGLEGVEPQYRAAVVGYRPCGPGGGSGAHHHRNPRHPLLLPERHALYNAPFRPTSGLCPAADRREPLRIGMHHLRGGGQHQEVGTTGKLRPQVHGKHRAGDQPGPPLLCPAESPALLHRDAYP